MGKAAIAGVDLAFSQDITAIFPDDARVDCSYLLRCLRYQAPRFKALSQGATIRGITREVVEETEIPLPPIEEQRRIAAILDRADALRGRRIQALAKLDSLPHAVFIDMFGDPARNPRGLPVVLLEAVADQITDGEHATPPRTDLGVKLLSARNVRNGYLDFENVDYVSPDTYQKLRRRCDPSEGDLLISCSGTIGRVAAFDGSEPLALVRSVALVRPSRSVTSSYLEFYLRSDALNRIMNQRANASSQSNLFQNQVRRLPVMLPPIGQQRVFAERVLTVAQSRSVGTRSMHGLKGLFASIQQRAFRGEL